MLHDPESDCVIAPARALIASAATSPGCQNGCSGNPCSQHQARLCTCHVISHLDCTERGCGPRANLHPAPPWTPCPTHPITSPLCARMRTRITQTLPSPCPLAAALAAFGLRLQEADARAGIKTEAPAGLSVGSINALHANAAYDHTAGILLNTASDTGSARQPVQLLIDRHTHAGPCRSIPGPLYPDEASAPQLKIRSCTRRDLISGVALHTARTVRSRG